MSGTPNRIPLYQVDAFTDRLFGGNPAAVCPLDSWLPDQELQAIAAENNLSETAYIVPSEEAGADYRIRWFTPASEVDLCGHATLATGYVLFHCLGFDGQTVRFSSRSGILSLDRDGDELALDFPSQPARTAPFPDGIERCLGVRPLEFLSGGFNVAVVADEAAVRAVKPDFGYIARMPGLGLIVTAEGDACDFVSRFFAPAVGIDEDPVTGSAHCVLTPLWAQRLGKTRLDARQISARGGVLTCSLEGDRVRIAGKAVLYLEGTIRV